MLSIIMIMAIIGPSIQQYPAMAYAEQRGQPEGEDFFSPEEMQNLLVLNETNIPDEDTAGAAILGQEEIQSAANPSKVGFENSNYYAVRSNEYAIIPVRMLEYNSRFPAVYYSIGEDSTAVEGVDYHPLNPDDMYLDFYQLDARLDFIAIKLINSGEETGTKTIVLTLEPPPDNPEAVVLEPYHQAVLTIVPDYDYQSSASYEYLYDGFAAETMFAENWHGLWHAVEMSYDDHKAIFLNSFGDLKGVEHVSPHPMASLTFQWRTNPLETNGGQYYSVISSQRGDITPEPNQLPEGSKIVTDITYPRPYGEYGEMTIRLEDERPEGWDDPNKGWYVGFYVDGDTWLELLTVKVQKHQLNVGVHLPRGASLEAAGESYNNSFNGKFDEGQETLKAVAGKGLKFENWVLVYYETILGQEPYINHNNYSIDSEISISALATHIANLEGNVSQVLLYPIFSQPSYTISAYAWPPEGGVAVAAKEHYRKDSTVSLRAIANQGYRFLYWLDWETGEVVSTEAEYSFPAHKNMSIEANFGREIGFEHAQYYAVRSNGYVLIPVVFTEPESAISYSVTGGTAVGGVDYEEPGENRTMYGWDYDGGIAFIPIKLIDSGQEGTRTIRLELHDPQDLVLGEQYWADVIIGPDYNYKADPSYKHLYNGYDLDNTGANNWEYPMENTYDTYKTLYIPSYDGQFLYGIQTRFLYPMDHLTFRWANHTPGKAYAIVAAAYLPGYRLPDPGEYERMLEITEPMTFRDDSFPLEDTRGKSMVVGFYADEGATLEVVSVEMLKRQYDVRVNLPRGGNLEVTGENYNETFSDSFNGRFDYEGAERLKAVPDEGYSFGGWMCYYWYDPDYVSDWGSPGKAEYIYLSGVGAEMTIQELRTAMGHAFGTMDMLDSWIQLRPIFTQQNVTIEAIVEPESVDKGTVTGGGAYLGGNPVALIARANPGFAFSHWFVTGKGNVYDNPYIFTAVEDLQSFAYFKPGFTIILEASPGAGGDVELVHSNAIRTLDLILEGEYFVGSGETVIARATPNPGYAFKNWTELDQQVWPTEDYTFIVEKNRPLEANFFRDELEIWVKANPIGIVYGGGIYNLGSEVTLTAVPYSGYEFVNWTVNGEVKSQEPIYTFLLTDPDALDYTANFQLTSFAVRPYKQFVGEPVQFDASMIFADNENITFDWNFGDGGAALGRDAGPVLHTFNEAGKYTVSVVATRAGTEEGVTKTREIVIVEPLPLEQSYFQVEPRGLRRVEPGGQVQWTVEFSNNGVPMMGKSITVIDEVANGSANITIDEYGRALYETTVPASGELGSFHTVTLSYETLRASVAVQVHSDTMTLRGQVFDSQSGRRLTGVRVATADGKESITDEEGTYTITGLSYGETCFLSVSHDGYHYHTSARKLDSAQAEHHIPLDLKPGNDPHILRIYSERTDSITRTDTFLTYGDELSLTFQAVINWGDHSPGKVDFILPNKTVQGTLNSLGAFCQINMDEEFKPGERLYVQAISDDVGYEVKDALFEVMPPPPFDTDSKEFELPPIDDIQAPADLKYIGGMNFGFDFKSMKTEFDVSTDGVASLYIGYVIDKKNAQPDDLSDPDKLREATKILNKLGGQKSVAKGTTDFDLVLGGKFTWTYCQTKTEWVLKEGWMAITGSASVTKTWYYMTPILVPVYIQAGAGGSISVKFMLVSEDHFFLEGTLTPALWLRVAAGVGLAGLLSAEIFGKIDGSLEVGIVAPDYKVEVGITGGVKVVALIYSETYSYRQAWKWPEVAGADYVMVLSEPGGVKPLSRDYLAEPSTWLPPGEIRVMAVGDGDVDNFKEMTIQTNVFPYSEPQLLPTVDGPMLVWLADNPARTDDNRTMAQYSLYDGTTWAAPQALHDDGTADFYPKVVGWQGNQEKSAAAAWMNVAEVLGNNTGYEEVLAKSRVAVSFYHRTANAWADFEEFTPPEGYQYTAPEMGAAGNSALVVWSRSPLQENGDLIATLYPEETDILFSYWNGSTWSGAGMAVAGAGRVIKSSLAYDGEKALLAYVVDEDGNFETVDDQELYYTTFTQGNWSAPVRVTTNNVQDTNPQAVYLKGEPLLFWYQDGKALYLKNLAGSPLVALDRQSDGLSDFTLAVGENYSLALVWGDGVAKEPANGNQVLAVGKDQDLGAQEIFTSVYDSDFDSWSQPIQLTDTGLFNRSIDAMLDAEGNVLAVFNRATVAMVDVEGEELEFETERTDLIFAELNLGFDLAVEEISLSEENPVPGSRVTASALVANLGERAWEDVKVAFYEGDPQFGGRQIGQTVIMEGILGAGEKRLTSIEWDIPKELEARSLYALVDPGHEVPDRNRQNNKDFVSAAMADLEVTEVTNQMVGFDEFLITATVINRGLITAENTTISLYGTEAGEYGPVRGDFLESGFMGGLLPGDQKEVTLRWRYKESDFGEDGTTFLALEAVSPTPNVLGGANTARVLIRKPVTEGGAVQGFELGRNTVTLLKGDQYQIQGVFNPSDANNRGITWQSNNEGIAQVDAGGKVYANTVGTAVITATTLDGGFSDTCSVTVVGNVSRIAGSTRYATSAAISQQGWPDGANTVLLARGDNYADALAGVPLAHQLGAPILLTQSHILTADTRNEIQRLGAKRVIILGGTGAISISLEDALLTDEGLDVTVVLRMAGSNRFDTAGIIALRLAEEQGKETIDTAVIAYGLDFPDALAAASYAAIHGYPILLTHTNLVPAETSAALTALGVKNVIVVGGNAVISDAVLTELTTRGSALRISGLTRYDTAVAIANHFHTGAKHMYLATGLNFPDAITGAVLAAKTNSGILLVQGSMKAPNPVVQDFLNDKRITAVTLFGGPGAISSEIEEWCNQN